MTFTPKEYELMTEAHLLKFVIGLLEMNHPEQNGGKTLHSITGVSESAIYQFTCGHGFMGAENWLKVLSVTGYKFIDEWLDVKRQQIMKEGKK